MKRIEKIDPETLTGEPRKIFERWSPGGKPLNIVLIYFRNIDLNRTWSYMATHLFLKNTLSDRQREIVVLRISWQCASDYEFIQHVRIAREGGLLSEEEMRDLTIADPALSWSQSERALIALCDELIASHGVSDETWRTLSAHLDNNQLMDAVATAGGYTWNSMATSSFGVDIETNMVREEGLTPSWNGDAFQFLQTSDAIANVSSVRLAFGDATQLEPSVRERIEVFLEKGARTEFFNMIASYPKLVRDWAPVIRYVDFENTLSPEERSLIAIRTAIGCASRSVAEERILAAQNDGWARSDLEEIKDASANCFQDQRRALLIEAVDELLEKKIIGDDLWTRMGGAFRDEELMDVVLSTAIELMVCWMSNALGIQPASAAQHSNSGNAA